MCLTIVLWIYLFSIWGPETNISLLQIHKFIGFFLKDLIQYCCLFPTLKLQFWNYVVLTEVNKTKYTNIPPKLTSTINLLWNFCMRLFIEYICCLKVAEMPWNLSSHLFTAFSSENGRILMLVSSEHIVIPYHRYHNFLNADENLYLQHRQQWIWQ